MFNLGIRNQIVIEDFSVVSSTGLPVIGLKDGDFTKRLYDPLDFDVTDIIIVTISELGNGNYRATFAPNVVGTWYLVVRNTTHFPNGKGASIQVYEADFDTLTDEHKKILGLVHQNISIDQTEYDEYGNLSSARLRIYTDSVSVGTSNNVISTYQITVVSTQMGRFTTWQQIEI